MSEFEPTPPETTEPAREAEPLSTPPPLPPQPPQQPQYAAPAAEAAAATQPQKKSRAGVFFLGALSGCLLLFVGFGILIAIIAASSGDSGTDFKITTQKVAIIPIEGEILDSRDVLEALHKYADNSMVKAIVIRINSPGGAIAPSQEIYSEIRSVRKSSGKPIIASLDSVAASGGFYIASACDDIVANPGSITGSIGVILQWFQTKDLINWAKLKPETITSGAMKDAGSPYRDMTEGERAYFQRIVLQLHKQFVHAVAEGRHGRISEEDVAKIADGRVFTGEEAVTLKLVDRLGTLDDAVRLAGERGGIHGEPARLWPRRRESSLIDLLGSSESKSVIDKVLSRRLPEFLYRW